MTFSNLKIACTSTSGFFNTTIPLQYTSIYSRIEAWTTRVKQIVNLRSSRNCSGGTILPTHAELAKEHGDYNCTLRVSNYISAL